MLLFKIFHASITGGAALVFTVIAIGPTRAVRENLDARFIALGGAITFGALFLQALRVASFAVLVGPVIVGSLCSTLFAMRSLKTRRETPTLPGEQDATQR
jgi:hypothetical protein